MALGLHDKLERTHDEKLELWGAGPWCDEPDREEFEAEGLPCLITRHPVMGHLCGYIAVPPGHPLHGKCAEDTELRAHGGVNYASPCFDRVCHVPKPGEPDDVWWFGFDCGHGLDGHPAFANERGMFDDYRDIVYVRHNLRLLAQQLRKAA